MYFLEFLKKYKLLGNGFDLAHGLPTSYISFLEFCGKLIPIYKNPEGRPGSLYEQEVLSNWEINKEIKNILEDAYKSRKKEDIIQFKTIYPRLDELYLLIENNIWFNYFDKCDKHGKENWIDFESGISDVIKAIDYVMRKYSISLYDTERNFSDGNTYTLPLEYPKIIGQIKKCKKIYGLEKVTYLAMRDYLLEDLNKLTRALEIYLTEIVGKIDIKKKSPDIEKLFAQNDYKFSRDPMVLNFNYTNTYQKVYLNGYPKYYKKHIDFIHGKADINNTIETNNMVLGIDEYLSKKRRNKNTEFIAFKKYYQRIYKETGSKYKKWINEYYKENPNIEYPVTEEPLTLEPLTLEEIMSYKNDFEKIKKLGELYYKKNNVYIFGHSLDITDKDILRDLMLNDYIYTTIFYHNKEELGKKIANLVKVIGQDELIRRTGGSTKTIKFVPQKKMK